MVTSAVVLLCALAAPAAAFAPGPRAPIAKHARAAPPTPPLPDRPRGSSSAPSESTKVQILPAHFVDSARAHIKYRRLAHARRTYQLGLSRFRESPEVAADLFLRAALLEQRAQNMTGARALFKHGARACPWRGKLFCSWGLFENKHGHGARVAGALLRHAVALDASIAPVLRWSHFRAHSAMRTEPGQLLRHPSRRMRVLMMASNSQTEERAVVEEGGAAAEEAAAAKPKYVKGQQPKLNRGWKIDGVWYDEEGPRNGPPMNYWKTSQAEKEEMMHTAMTDLARAGDEKWPAAARELERRSGILKPALNRRIGGAWRLLSASRAAAVARFCPDAAPQQVGAPTSCAASLAAGGGDEMSATFNAVSPQDARIDQLDGAPIAAFRITYICDAFMIARAEDDALLIYEKETST